MLKLGNTYLNFGGTYLKDWNTESTIEENGWKQLFHISPSSYKSPYPDCVGMMGPQKFGGSYYYEKTFINDGHHQAYSGYVTQVPSNDNNVFAKDESFTVQLPWNDPNYFLIHCQVAPHCIVDGLHFETLDIEYNSPTAVTATFNGSSFNNFNSLHKAISSYCCKRLISAMNEGGGEQGGFGVNFRLNDDKKLNFLITAGIPNTTISPLEGISYNERYFVDRYNVLTWLNGAYIGPYSNNDMMENYEGYPDVSSCINPFTVDYLVKNNTNKIGISAYYRNISGGNTHNNSFNNLNVSYPSGKNISLEISTLNCVQLDGVNQSYRPNWLAENSASFPIINVTGKTQWQTFERTYSADSYFRFNYFYKGFEIPSFGISGCYVSDPEANDMFNKLKNRSYTAGEV